MELIVYLMAVYAATMLMNVVVSYLLWRGSGTRFYIQMANTWALGMLSLVASILVAGSSPLVRGLWFVILLPYYLGLSRILAGLVGIPFRARPYVIAVMAAVAFTLAVVALGGPLKLGIAAICATTGACTLRVGGTALFRHWSRMSVSLKGYALTLFVSGFHALDFPIAYDHPTLPFAGFTLGTMLGIAFTLFGQGAVLESVVGEKSRLEVELAYKSKLTQAAKLSALGEMAGGVAHEINNPLAVIQTNAGQVQDLLSETPLDVEMLRSMCDQIEKTTQRISAIVKGLRSFSRDGSADPLRPAPIRQIVEDTLALCTQRFKNNRIQLEVDAGPPDLEARCRAVEISQVVLNLLNNAFDAVAEAEGERSVKVRVTSSAEHVKVSVADSGAGIPADILDRIFQPFFTTKEIGKGTGLGLSISRGIAEAHGGSLSIDTSSPNTRFVLTLLRAERRPIEVRTPSAA